MGGAPEEDAAQDRQAGSTPETRQSHPAEQHVMGLLDRPAQGSVSRGPSRQPERLLEEQGRWGREKQCLG